MVSSSREPQPFAVWKELIKGWGMLISKFRNRNPDVALYGTCFKIGRSSDCEFWIRDDTTISEVLCQFKYTVQEDGSAAIYLEGIGIGCIIYNGHYFGLRDVVRIKDGDEIDLGATLYHKYTIVLKLPNVDGTENEVATGKVGYFDAFSAETWPGTFLHPSSPAWSIESPWAMPILISPPASNDVNIHQEFDMSPLAPPHEFATCIEGDETCSVEGAFIEDQIKQSIFEIDNDATFDNFPYFLGQNTKGMLIESTFIHLKRKGLTNHTVELPTISPRLLLSGPAGTEMYQEMLVKALANHFGAKLLIFDISATHTGLFAKDTELLKGDERPKSEKFVDNWPSSMSSATKSLCSFHLGTASNCQAMPIQESLAAPYFSADAAASERNSFQRGARVKYIRIHPGHKSPQAPLWPSSWQLHRQPPTVAPSIHLFFEVLTRESKNGPKIFFMKNLEKLIINNLDIHAVLKSKLKKLAEGVVVVCSHTEDDDTKGMDDFGRLNQNNEHSKLISDLFPNKVNIQIPQDGALLVDWKRMLQQNVERHKLRENQQCIEIVLSRNNLECDGFDTTCIKDQVVTDECAEKIVGWALSHHLMNNNEPHAKDEKLVLSSESVYHALKKFLKLENDSRSSKNPLKDVTLDRFEERLLENVIPPSEIGVRFEDIGALENVKDMLKEMVLLPVQRPELFCKGHLTKPCKGILLFGPPGTGKTMLAKAIATEACANLINISISSITSMNFGESEKSVKAIFSLARKLSPSVIFIDEVDSMLGRRTNRGEHEVMRNVKCEFMFNWDGLCTKDRERVLVLATTNRPFDIDEAVIRRFPLRLLVNFPNAPNRAKILKAILAKEELAKNVDLDAIASITEGFSGCDLKDLCVIAARCPIREILEKENKEKALAIAEGRPIPSLRGKADIRAINMDDMQYAHDRVCPSASSDSANMSELLRWNQLYGQGGPRPKVAFDYFM